MGLGPASRIERFEGDVARGSRLSPGLVRVPHQAVNRAREGLGVLGGHEFRESSVTDEVGDPADAGGEEGDAGLHGLDGDEGGTLRPRTQDDEVEGGEVSRGIGERSRPVHPRREIAGPGPRLERLAELAIADEGESPVGRGPGFEVREGREENVGSLLRAQASDPSDLEALVGEAESGSGLVPTERIGMGAAGVGKHVDALRGDPPLRELPLEGRRDGDDALEAPEGTGLKPLVEAVFPAAPREAVDGRQTRDPLAARHVPVQHVGTVPMGVHEVWVEFVEEPADPCPFGTVGAGREVERVQRSHSPVAIHPRMAHPDIEDHYQVHVGAERDKLTGEVVDDLLRPSVGGGGDDVDDPHRRFREGAHVVSFGSKRGAGVSQRRIDPELCEAGTALAPGVLRGADSAETPSPDSPTQRMTKLEPRISVVIPTYNRAPALKGAVESVLAQSLRAHEIILVDDGSTDETEEVARALPGPVRYVRQENGGAAAARNHGISLSEGDLVAFLDSDDRWEPRKLEIQARILEEHPHVGWVISDILKVDAQGDALPGEPGIEAAVPVFRDLRESPAEWMARDLKRLRLEDGEQSIEVLFGDAFPLLLEGNFLFPSTLVVRRPIIDAVGGFDPAFTRVEDFDLALRLAAVSPMAFADRSTVRYAVGGVDALSNSSHMSLLTSNTLLALDRAAKLRDPIEPESVLRLHHGIRRVLLDQAYHNLTTFDREGARNALGSLGERSLSPGLRGWLLRGASFLPTGVLRAAHWLKRRSRGRSPEASGTVLHG